MNPRTKYEEADPATARAFAELFRRHNDDFRFPIDHRDDEDLRELRGRLTPKDATEDNQSTITITGINMPSKFEAVADTARGMGLVEIETEEATREHEEHREYTSQVLVSTTPTEQSIDAEWNVPTLIIYGSLSPELEEAIHEAIGTGFNVTNVRNHILISGDSLEESHRTRITSTIQGASYIFDDEKRDLVSNVRTAPLC